MKLSSATLPEIAARGLVDVPGYDRSGLVTGIVHFGVGNFHRAHQAVVIDVLLRRGLARDFAICGVGVLPSDRGMRDVMAAQDGLFVHIAPGADGVKSARVIGSIVDYIFAPSAPRAVIERLARPETRIVSLTVTEGGYFADPVTGEFDASHPDVCHDVAHPQTPRTSFGLILAGLRARRAAGQAPFSVVSCDNLPGNGEAARRALLSLARLTAAGAPRGEREDRTTKPDLSGSAGLAEWIADHVSFPNSMVDRITPATGDAERAEVLREFGVADAWPVTSEGFLQWVVEDDFRQGRPPLEQAGVQLVDDVAPYELMKLRLLNVTHQAIAYFGLLAGYRTVAEALGDRELREFARGYMVREGAPTLRPVPGINVVEYIDTLLARLRDPATRDTLGRLAAHTSDRIPKWLVPVVRENLAAGRSVELAAGIVASWARYAAGFDERGEPFDVVDRLARELREVAGKQREQPLAFLEQRALFGDLAAEPRFAAAYLRAIASLERRGAAATFALLAEEARAPVVVFDLGGVLVDPQGLPSALAERIGCSPETLHRPYWDRRREYDLGLAARDYWTGVLAALGVVPSADLIADLTRLDSEGWTTLRCGAQELLSELYAAGARIAILSNATHEMAAAARGSDWAAWVSDWFFSAELARMKPDPEIFARVAECLGAPAESIRYFEDNQGSVDAAVAAGWDGQLWSSDHATREHLVRAGLLPGRVPR